MVWPVQYPRTNFFDDRTGQISREWQLFFQALFVRTGSDNGVVSSDTEDTLNAALFAPRAVNTDYLENRLAEVLADFASRRVVNIDSLLHRIIDIETRLDAIDRRMTVNSDSTRRELEEARMTQYATSQRVSSNHDSIRRELEEVRSMYYAS